MNASNFLEELKISQYRNPKRGSMRHRKHIEIKYVKLLMDLEKLEEKGRWIQSQAIKNQIIILEWVLKIKESKIHHLSYLKHLRKQNVELERLNDKLTDNTRVAT